MKTDDGMPAADREGSALSKFHSSAAAQYDATIVGRVPGYALLHELAAAAMAALAPAGAHLLLVGAGTGAELVRLASLDPSWRFTAIDPSADMLAQAKGRLAAAGIGNRVRWIEASVPPMPLEAADARYDAALSLLVSHFLPGNSEKQAFISAIAESLAPNAPLLIADLFRSEHSHETTHGLRDAWARQSGASAEAVAQMSTRMARDFHPVDEPPLARLAAQAGLTAPARLFQALDFKAFVLRKADACRQAASRA